MNKSKIIAKLDTYIKEYSKLLDINSQLNLTLEKEKQEKEILLEKINKCEQIVDDSTNLVQKTIQNTEIIISQIEKYKEDTVKMFDELDKIIKLILNKENFSNKEIQNLKEKLDNLKKDFDKPIK